MACVVVWDSERDESPEADETKAILIRLSGRSMKSGRPATAPALLAGYVVLLAMHDLFSQTDFDIHQLQQLANQALSLQDSS